MKYSFTPESVGSFGVGSHTDPGFLTVLQDDEVVGGLEVADKHSGSFLPVETSPGNFFVIMGDMARVWSNGRLTNAKHRVRCNEASIRVSMGSFFKGPLQAAVEAPEEFLSDSPRLYNPIYFKQYAEVRSSDNVRYSNGEALSLYRVES